MAKRAGPVAPNPVLKVRGKVPEPAKAPTTPHETSPEFDNLGGLPHQFAKPPAAVSYSYGHEKKVGDLRVSGHPGAHRIGKR